MNITMSPQQPMLSVTKAIPFQSGIFADVWRVTQERYYQVKKVCRTALINPALIWVRVAFNGIEDAENALKNGDSKTVIVDEITRNAQFPLKARAITVNGNASQGTIEALINVIYTYFIFRVPPLTVADKCLLTQHLMQQKHREWVSL